MKNVMNFSLVLLLFFIGSASFAQWYGIKGGYNLATTIMKNDAGDNSDQFTNKEGFNVGLLVQFPMTGPFSFEPSLMLSSKGYLTSWESIFQGEPVKTNSTTTLTYLDIPINAKASFKLGKVKLYGTFGPYLGIGLSGERKRAITTISSGQTSTYFYDIKYGPDKETDNLRRVDIGINAGAGIDFSKMQLSVTYGMGLRNLSLISVNNTISKNRVLAFSLAYKISYGSFTSPDYKLRIKAVKRTHNQIKLLKSTVEDLDINVRIAAFNKLNSVSLNDIINGSYDPALIIAAKIRLNKTTWSDEFRKGSDSRSSLGNVIGAAALVNSPQPTSFNVISACHKYIQEADAAKIPELINLLNRFGDKSLAEDYMNCGNNELKSAGESWGRAHGYNIGTGNGSNRVRWGEKK